MYSRKNVGPIMKPGVYIKCCILYNPNAKALEILSDTAVRRSAVDREDLKPYWKSEESPHLSRYQQSYYLQVFRRLY